MLPGPGKSSPAMDGETLQGQGEIRQIPESGEGSWDRLESGRAPNRTVHLAQKFPEFGQENRVEDGK